jgi:hypothetical protein
MECEISVGLCTQVTRKAVTHILGRGRENDARSGPTGMTNKKTVPFRAVAISFMERRFSNSKIYFIFWNVMSQNSFQQEVHRNEWGDFLTSSNFCLRRTTEV